MRARAVRIVAAGLLLALALARSASAEPVASLGVGTLPSVVVDPTGTAIVVSHGRDAIGRTFLLACRLPPGALTCSPQRLPEAPHHVVRAPHVLRRTTDGALFVVASGIDATPTNVLYLWSSTNGGLSWSGPRLAATGANMRDVDDAQLTPDGAAIDAVEGIVSHDAFVRIPLTGAGATAHVSLLNDPAGAATTFYYHLGLGELTGGRALLVSDGAGRVTHFRRFAGANLYDPAAWTPWTASPGIRAGEPAVANGPGGPALIVQGSLADPGMWVSRWSGARFGPRRRIGAHESFNSGPALAQDPAGTLHAVWVLSPKRCGGLTCVAYRSARRAHGFGAEVDYPIGTTAQLTDPRVLRVAANAAGHGEIVWTDTAGRLRGLPLVPPPPGAGPSVVAVGHGQRVSLQVPAGCVASAAPIVATVRASRRVHIIRVSFRIDRGSPLVDRRRPFRATFRVTLPPGTRHVVHTRITYRRKGSHRLRHRTLGRQFVIC